MKCTSGGCDRKATFHLTYIEKRKCVREEHLCEDHARVTLTSGALPPAGPSRAPCVLEGARHFDLDMIVISEINDQQVVYLREVGGDRRVPILIGIFEATSLDRGIKGYQSPRPLTHDAMAIVVRAMDGEVQDVVVDSLKEVDTLKEKAYHAKVRIRQGTRQLTVDLRPSDAFMLAVAFNSPIFFADEVLELVAPSDR